MRRRTSSLTHSMLGVVCNGHWPATPSAGVVINDGQPQPEEESVLRNSSAARGVSDRSSDDEDVTMIDWCDVAELVLFALTARFLGSQLNTFQAEKLHVELFKQRRSWWSKL